ncbi:NADP-dependent oxidoreductase [Sediminibacillus halophilus]|uniref:NADPH:quinone reductase n=1 Tax=Sediminibacillus halophilus TaxID=482461 RepID=A0A1G9R271_9BACI|nr:NADP-dependent oxidoreductase [Sediminibacillus halophilus]SDM17210.1 NADPH:quinone reductase [Sediminibacillus halophilus]
MKAVVIDQYGSADQLHEIEMEKPALEAGQVLVEMHATSVNPIDWKLREGYLKEMLPFEFPIILGWDAAGIVKEVGSDVSGFQPGDRVFARPATTRNGTYAEYTAIDKELLAKIPENISFEEAAAVPLAGLTAWQCLVDFAGIKQGDKVLVHAGSGGVGSFAIQIAKSFGAYVASTASGKNEDFLKQLGVDRFINYQEEDFAEVLDEYDVVVDTLGGDIQKKSFEILKEGGTLVSIVGEPDKELANKKQIKSGSLWLNPNGDQLAELGKLMESGKLHATVGQTFPLTTEGVRAAHKLSETHHARGKIVIKIR